MMNLRLGQSSMEFLSFVGISALLLASMYGLMANKQQQAFEYENRRNALKVAEKVGFQAEMALVQGDGYSRVFSLPNRIGGDSYNVTLRDDFTVIEWANNTIRRETLYSKKEINISTQNTNVFRVVNHNGEVSMVEQ